MSLRNLMREVCAGVEIYYSGSDYFKTAFVLCDDYTELASKLWLVQNVPSWSGSHDKEARKLAAARRNVAAMARGAGTATADEITMVESGNRFDKFKSYDEVLNDVGKAFKEKRPTEVSKLDGLQRNMKLRRKDRNGFFHSADMLSLNKDKTECVEAFCDLLDYGKLLFGKDWDEQLNGARNLDTLQILLRLEHKAASKPTVRAKILDVFEKWPVNVDKGKAPLKGALVAKHPDDLHLRLCVIHGDSELKKSLETLLVNIP